MAATLFMLGWRVSFSGPALLAAIVLSLSLDIQAYSNNLYLMSWLVLLSTLANAAADPSISGTPISRVNNLTDQYS